MSEHARVDLLIVGGGVNGAGIARDAVGRGLSVMLVEREALLGVARHLVTPMRFVMPLAKGMRPAVPLRWYRGCNSLPGQRRWSSPCTPWATAPRASPAASSIRTAGSPIGATIEDILWRRTKLGLHGGEALKRAVDADLGNAD